MSARTEEATWKPPKPPWAKLERDINVVVERIKRVEQDVRQISEKLLKPGKTHLIETLKASGMIQFAEGTAIEQLEAFSKSPMQTAFLETSTTAMASKKRVEAFCDELNAAIEEAYAVMGVERTVAADAFLNHAGPKGLDFCAKILDQVNPTWHEVPKHIRAFGAELRANERLGTTFEGSKSEAAWLTVVAVVSLILDTFDQLEASFPIEIGVDAGVAAGLELDVSINAVSVWAWKMPIHILLTAFLETAETYIGMR